jgi:hypothetical protein
MITFRPTASLAKPEALFSSVLAWLGSGNLKVNTRVHEM